MGSSRYPEAAFLAAMTASATHEVRNVLAIIKESAGLIGDLLLLAQKRGALDEEKVHKALDRIEVQVKRGADLLTNLNRLSHTLDEERAAVDLGQEVEQAVFLSQRFARKKGHQVLAGPVSGEPYPTVDPLLMHMVLFAAVRCCLEELPEGSTLQVCALQVPDGAMVEFRAVSGSDATPAAGGAASPVAEGKGPPAAGGTPLPVPTPQAEAWDSLVSVARSAGASVTRANEGYGIRLLFHEGAAGGETPMASGGIDGE